MHCHLVEIVEGNKYKGSIYMVFEYMDHDLTGLADRPGMRFTVPQIKVEPPVCVTCSCLDVIYFVMTD
jgi:hypothetical protein